MRMFIESAESEQDLQDGQLQQALARLRIAVGATHATSGVIELTNGNAWAGVLYGVACYEAGRFDQAMRLLHAYLPVVQTVGSHDHLILALVCLARMARAQGDSETALRYLADLEHAGSQRNLPRLIASAWLERSRQQVLAGQADAAKTSLARADFPEVWAQDQPLRRLAHTALNMQIGQLRWDLHFGDARQALRGIDGALASSTTVRWRMRSVSLELMRAAALSRCKQESAALDQLLSTLSFAAEQGVVSRVLDEGPLVMTLVQGLAIRGQDPRQGTVPTTYLSQLLGQDLSQLGARRAIPQNQSAKGESIPLLTQKELQILSMLTEGHSNRALAQEFGVSENTVRTHLRNINAKLEVKSRMQAVAKARQLGLLIK